MKIKKLIKLSDLESDYQDVPEGTEMEVEFSFHVTDGLVSWNAFYNDGCELDDVAGHEEDAKKAFTQMVGMSIEDYEKDLYSDKRDNLERFDELNTDYLRSST